MATPFNFSGALNLPGDQSLPPAPIPFNFSSAFESEVKNRLSLTGSGSKVINFGTVDGGGAKFVAVKVETGQGAMPVQLQFNAGGAPGEIEVSPGGFFILASPAPTGGILALTVVYTANVVVDIWALE